MVGEPWIQLVLGVPGYLNSLFACFDALNSFRWLGVAFRNDRLLLETARGASPEQGFAAGGRALGSANRIADYGFGLISGDGTGRIGSRRDLCAMHP